MANGLSTLSINENFCKSMKLSSIKVAIVSTLMVVTTIVPATYAMASEATAQSSATAKASDWDSILDSYEKYVDDYIVLMKKVKAGDMDAMTESLSMMQTCTTLSKKLQGADGSLTPEQMSRYVKITSKMASAAM